MFSPLPAPRRIVVMTHPYMPQASVEAADVVDFLRHHGVEKAACGLYNDPDLQEEVRAGAYDLIIALGGDGTMLRAGHLAARAGVPVLGINMGRFGFLMEVRQADWRQQLPQLFSGNFRLEKRMMLNAGHVRSGQLLGEWDVINDVVVTRGNFVRPIRLVADVDGHRLASYIADGLIAATPTGSTAYALAVGGPILPPELRNILIVAVAPHLSLDRAVILSEGASVAITVSHTHEAVLSVDGQPPLPLLDGDCVTVTARPQPVSFVRFQDPGYFYQNIMHYMSQNPAAGDPQ